MQNKTTYHKPLGIALTAISGLIAIGIVVWFSHSAAPLLSLILLAWGIESFNDSKKPLTLGLILSASYLLIGIVAWYTNDISVLWAMILANWLGDSISNN